MRKTSVFPSGVNRMAAGLRSPPMLVRGGGPGQREAKGAPRARRSRKNSSSVEAEICDGVARRRDPDGQPPAGTRPGLVGHPAEVVLIALLLEPGRTRRRRRRRRLAGG